MIPRILQLKNFLSYGPEPQTVNFGNYNLICLSGKNGHGKSALLDAITWAIWGQARKGSGNAKADSGLLHLGQKHMFVILEFEINGQQYRIRREFVQTNSKPFTSLDFGIMQTDGKIAALTDKTIKATQDVIEKTIGITFESFINSAFLRQGQSNEFSKKSPKERKEILADILQLQQFELQKKIAVQQTRKLQTEHALCCTIEKRIEAELTQLQNLAHDYQQNLTNAAAAQKQKQHLLVQKQQYEQEKNILMQKNNELTFLQKKQHELQKELEQTNKQLHDANIAQQQQEQMLTTQQPKELEEQQKKLQHTIQDMQTKLQTTLQLREQYLTTREKLAQYTLQYEQERTVRLHAIQQQHTCLQQELFQIEQKIHHEKTTMQRIDQELKTLHQTFEQLKKIVQKNSVTLHSYHQQEKEYETTNKQLHHWRAQQGMIQQQLQKLEQQTLLIQNPLQPCPLCLHPLAPTYQQHAHNNTAKEIAHCKQIFATLEQHIQETQPILQQQQELLLQTKQQHELVLNSIMQQSDIEKKITILEKQKSDCTVNNNAYQADEKMVQGHLATSLKKLEELEQEKLHIAQKPEYKILYETLTTIEKTGKELGYNQETHKQAQEQLEQITKTLHNNTSLAELTQKIVAQKAQITALQTTKIQHLEQLHVIEQHIKQHQDLPQETAKLQHIFNELEKEIATCEQLYTQFAIEKGVLEQKQKKLYDLQTEQIKLTKDAQVLYQEIIDYTEIAKALGKDGIQALLIEQAIPEIEQETNEILGRLTNNQTHIFIESLRDLKKGGSKETLDIKISDAFGLRDYELFSGGEAFRIDFALRIGISKLLARRAGTTLQTIFIDEGFGSQDEEGLQLIMDNLYKIQNDFAKIIIVSHLAEMKDQFPVQFIVEKKRLGSTISVVEQG